MQSPGPYVRADGTVIAANWAGLTSGQLQAPLEVTEQNMPIETTLVWTGTNSDGTWVGGDPAFADCDGWMPVDAMGGGNGQSNLTDSGWTASGNLSCIAGMQPIYCFQQG